MRSPESLPRDHALGYKLSLLKAALFTYVYGVEYVRKVQPPRVPSVRVLADGLGDKEFESNILEWIVGTFVSGEDRVLSGIWLER